MKIRLLFQWLMPLLFTVTATCQVQVGTGTLESENLPFEPYFGSSYAQNIYLQSDINASGTITAIQYFYSGISALPDSQDLTVYMGEVARNEFAGVDDWEPLANLTQVYTGGITVTAGTDGWTTLTLDTPFVYSGTQNLLVAIDENAASFDEFADDFHCTASALNQGLSSFSDSTNPDPASPPDGTLQDSFANIIFDGIQQTCPLPTDITVSVTNETTADASWTAAANETGGYTWEVVDSGSGQGNNVVLSGTTTTGTTSVNLTGLTAASLYDFLVRNNCASENSAYSRATTFRTPGPGDECSDPVALTVNAFGDCSTVYNLDFANSVDLGITAASCDTGGVNRGKWFEFTAPASASIILTSSDESVEFAIFDACGGTELECEDSPSLDSGIIDGLTAGNNYKLMVWKDSTTSGTTDVCLQAGPTCLEPTDLDATNITDTSAELSWTSGGSGETAWDIEVVNITQGQTATGNPQINGVNNPYILPGLNPATVYEYYVRANCGGGDTSTFGGPFQFRTDGPLDNCATAQTLTIEADCATATPFTLDLAAAGDLGALTGCDTGGTNTGGWFEFTTTSIETVTINSSVAMKIQILDSCGGAEVVCESAATSHIISGLTANTNYKMAMWVDGTSSSVSEICIQEGPTCFVPTALAADNVTQNSADLSWTAPTLGTTPVGFNVEVVIAETAPTGTPTDTNVVSGFTKSGLSPNTRYDFYVYADCGNGDISEAAGPFSFTTFPVCGDTVFDSGGPNGQYSNNENYTVTFFPNDPITELAQLEFQLVDLEFSNFFCGGFCDTISVYDGLDDTAPELTSAVPQVDVDNGDAPIIYTASNASGALTIKFESDGFGSSDQGFEVLFNCVARPACENPSDLAVNVVDGTTAEYSWTAGLSGETQWDLAVVPEGATAPTSPTINDVTSNPYTDSTLNPGTRYDVYLRADCSSSNSAFVGPESFRTPGPGDTADTSIGLTVETACDATTQTVLDFTNAADLGNVATCASAFSENLGAWYQFRPNRNTSAVFLNSSEEVQYALFTVDGSGNADIELECGTLTAATQVEVSQLNFRDDYKLVIWDDSGSLTSTSICIENGPTCPTPTGLGITNVASTTADFVWTPGLSNQTSFDVVVTVPGGDPNVPADVLQSGTVTTNSFTATGLVVGDSYDFYVTGDCDPANAGTDVSMMAGPLEYTQVGPGESCAASINLSVNADCTDPNAVTFSLDYDQAVDIGPTASCDSTTGNIGAWFNFIAPSDGAVIITSSLPNEYVVLDACGGNEIVCINTETTDSGIISGLVAGQEYKIALWRDDFNVDAGDISEICLQEAPSCLPVIDLDVTNITPSGGDVEWNLGDSSQNLFEIEVVNAGQPQTGANVITGVTASPFTLNTLMSGTSYDVYVRADCGNGDFSDWTGPFTFDTECVDIIPNYATGFDTFLPSCWSEASGGDASTGPNPGSDTSAWVDDTFGNQGSSAAPRFNIFGTGTVAWLISPAFDLSAGGYELNYDVALTEWANTNPGTINSDDQVQLLMSESGGPWMELELYDSNNVPSATGDAENFALTSTDSSVRFAFLAAEGATGGGDFEFFVDNFQVRTPPSCFEVNNLNVVSTTATTADITFNSGNATSSGNFEYVVVPADDPAPTGSGIAISDAAVTNGSYAFTIGDGTNTGPALSPSTSYDLYVREICGAGDASPYNISGVNFDTQCVPEVPSYTETFTNFDGNAFDSLSCWQEATGGDEVTGPTTFQNDSWVNDDFLNDDTPNANGISAKFNMFGENVEGWLLTPEFDLSAGNYTVSMDVGLTVWNNTTPGALESDDIIVLVYTLDGTTWTEITRWDDGNVPSNTGENFSSALSLSGASASNVRFAFYADSNQDLTPFGGPDPNVDIDFFMDNFRVDVTASNPGLEQASQISLYPNPVSGDILNLDMGTNVSGDVNIMIHNALGQMVRRESMSSSSTIELDGMSTLSEGMYFITVDAGGKQQTIKFLKE